MNTIQITQVGNLIDPYNKDNSYTYDFTGYETTTTSPYDTVSNSYLTTIVNSYEKCLIALSWNRLYNGNTFQELQVVRTTYTIKTHVDFVHDTATEFYSTGSYIHKESGSIPTVQSNLWSPCRMQNRYYWHPYEKLYFFLDTDASGDQYLVVTCFPYTSKPTTACDVNFASSTNTKFHGTKITGKTVTGGTIYHIEEFITFGMTSNEQVKSAYAAVVVQLTNGQYQSRIHRLTFTDTDCQNTVVGFEQTPVYSHPSSNTISHITSLAAIHNVGVGFAIEGSKGIHIVSIAKDGTPTAEVVINDSDDWKLIQMGIDTGDPPPVFAISKSDKSSFYRVTNIATHAYYNDSLNFYDYPVDVGRFHVMVVHPGGCGETAPLNHDKISVLYVSLETMEVDMCIDEMPENECGNGILDGNEECDDGNNRVENVTPYTREGDGCSPDCKVEIGWRCYNNPYNTRTLCEANECGDSFINKEDPENEECDDGNLYDGDGCTSTCKKMKGYFCPLPGFLCIKVCNNSKLDYYPGPPHNLEEYQEECDDGNTDDNDGKFIIKLLGCSSDCLTIEYGYECIVPGQLCRLICGNGYHNKTDKYGDEQCDIADSIYRKGCTNCRVDYGYKCPTFGEPW